MFGRIDAFQGLLNPLSALGIFKTCVLPILLYGCETWLLDLTSVKLLESFQYEIGRKILKLPKWYSGTAIRLCLELPSIASLVLVRKLKFLSKLLIKDTSTNLSSQILTAGLITDPLGVSIVQQCRLLEHHLGLESSALDECLMEPDTADYVAMKSKDTILDFDRNQLLSKAKGHPTANLIGAITTINNIIFFLVDSSSLEVSSEISWLRIWDEALDHGPKGTSTLQKIIRVLAHPCGESIHCFLCGQPFDTSFLTHIHSDHPISSQLSVLSTEDNIDSLVKVSDGSIFKLKFS